MTDKMEEALRKIAAMEDQRGALGVLFYNAIQIARDALPRPLEVGDEVKNFNGTRGEIKAIDGACAWVRFQGAPENMTVRIVNLERV